jgi:hypothetical protein
MRMPPSSKQENDRSPTLRTRTPLHDFDDSVCSTRVACTVHVLSKLQLRPTTREAQLQHMLTRLTVEVAFQLLGSELALAFAKLQRWPRGC